MTEETKPGQEQPEQKPEEAQGAQTHKCWCGRVEEMENTLREKAREVEQLVRDGLKSAVPPGVGTHLSNAKREFLLAVRKFIDRELEKTGPEPEPKDEAAKQ